MLSRIAALMAFIAAIFVFTSPVSAAPAAQPTVPTFTLNAQTTLSVTIVLSDAITVVVPVEVEFIAQNQDGTADIAVVTDVEQQQGMTITVESSGASMTATVTPTTTTVPADEASDGASYTVIRNANIRSGPGTDFDIVRVTQAGDLLTVVGQNEDGTWLELEDGNWIAAFLVTPAEANADSEDSAAATATLSPTITITATPTRTPGAAENQAALAAYLIDVATLSNDMSEALAVLQELLQNPEPASAQWRLQVAAQIAVISDAYEQYLALTPVPSYEDLHDQVVDMSNTCKEATDLLAVGGRTISSSEIIAAAELVESCATKVADLARDLQTLP